MQQDLEAPPQAPDKSTPGAYPRYTTLLASDDVFRVFRRFTRVRMRLLLAQQDKLTMLEEKLDSIDRNEDRRLFLGSMRMDGNQERRQVLIELKAALKEYDALLEQTKSSTLLPDPDSQDVDYLRKWIEGMGFNRAESGYLKQSDLGSLAVPCDRAPKIIQAFVEKAIVYSNDAIGRRFPRLHYKPTPSVSTENVRVFILSPFLRGFSRLIAICLISLIMLLPRFVLPRLTSIAERVSASVVTAAAVLVSVAFFTQARTIELVACGASYTAVIVALTASMPTNIDIHMRDACNQAAEG